MASRHVYQSIATSRNRRLIREPVSIRSPPYAYERFALVAVAGELATKAGLTGWKEHMGGAGVPERMD